MRFGVCALVLVGGVPSLAGAQEVQDTTQLEELVVTATRIPTPPDAVVSSVTTITGDELRNRGVRFVQDALRQVPGAMVVQPGSYGGVSSLFLRGGESDYVKVLIDGVPVNQSGGSYNWANLTTANLDRIEILRGPASVIYGSDAVTGVVQVFTRRGVAGFSADAAAEAGTFGTVAGQGGVRGGSSRLTYSADVSRTTTDGIYSFNNQYGNTVLSGALRTLPDDRTDASLAVRYSDNRYEFPTDFTGALADSNQVDATRTLSMNLEAGRRFGGGYELRLTAGGSRSHGEFEDRPDHEGDTLGFGFASTRDSRSARGNLDVRLSARPVSALSIIAGGQIELETERQSGETTSNFGGIFTTPNTPFDRNRTTTGAYLQSVIDLPAGLAVNLNGRVDHNSGFGTFFTFRAGALYRIAAATRLRGSIGRAFKAPTFCEQFCDDPFEVGDPGLRPERATSWEVGLEHDILSNQLSLWTVYFDQRFRDMIIYNGSAVPGAPTYINGAAAEASGIEAGLTSSVSPGVKASLSYTYLSTEATDDAGMPSASFVTGQRLIRRPAHSAEFTLSARLWTSAVLGGSVTYVGERQDVDFAQSPSRRVALPPHVVVDLAGEAEILPGKGGNLGVAVTARVENLFDEDYTQTVGFPGRGRAVFGGGRVRF